MNEAEKLDFLLNTPAEVIKAHNFSSWRVSPDGSTGMKGFTGEPELAIGSVLGYRWWKMYLHQQEALIGAYGGKWRPGKDVYEADCQRSLYARNTTVEHKVPDPDCGCGYWCYWKPDSAESVMGRGTGNTGAFFQGVVEGFGVVLIGDKGFRCGKAKLRGIALDTDNLRKQMNDSRKSGMVRTPWGQVELKTEGAVATHAAITGRGLKDTEPVPEELIMAAAAEVEEKLEELYPQAKVFSSLNTMQKYFGLDKNYGRTSARNPEITAKGKEYLQDALIKLAVTYCDIDMAYERGFLYSEPLDQLKRMRLLLQEIVSEI